MPRRSIEQFTPTDRWMADTFYTEDEIEDIVRESGHLPPGDILHDRVLEDGSGFEKVMVPRRVALVERLESAASLHQVKFEWQAAPTRDQLAAHYRNIEDAAKALLDVLVARRTRGALLLGGLPPTDDLRAVIRLRQWARDCRSWAATRPELPRHGADEALDEFICCLGRIWRDVLGRGQPGRSVNNPDRDGRRREGGPFARFVLVALRPLRPDLPTETQIADRIKKLKGMGKLAP